jgi:hypothetical protein
MAVWLGFQSGLVRIAAPGAARMLVTDRTYQRDEFRYQIFRDFDYLRTNADSADLLSGITEPTQDKPAFWHSPQPQKLTADSGLEYRCR